MRLTASVLGSAILKYTILQVVTLSLAAMLGVTSGCGKQSSDPVKPSVEVAKSAAHSKQNPPAPPKKDLVEPVVQYPAAAVFEGGLGDPNSPDQKFTPLWRLYICLKATKEEKSGKVVLDFEKLNQILESDFFEEGSET